MHFVIIVFILIECCCIRFSMLTEPGVSVQLHVVCLIVAAMKVNTFGICNSYSTWKLNFTGSQIVHLEVYALIRSYASIVLAHLEVKGSFPFCFQSKSHSSYISAALLAGYCRLRAFWLIFQYLIIFIILAPLLERVKTLLWRKGRSPSSNPMKTRSG